MKEIKYIITLLCTDTDGVYYNDVIDREFDTEESAMSAIRQCIKQEQECVENATIEEYENGAKLIYNGICLTDYEIRAIQTKKSKEDKIKEYILSRNIQYDLVGEDLLNIINGEENDENTTRRCTNCGKEMVAGYCLYDGLEYYCSNDCLYTNYSKEEYNKLYDNNDGYWTEWEE